VGVGAESGSPARGLANGREQQNCEQNPGQADQTRVILQTASPVSTPWSPVATSTAKPPTIKAPPVITVPMAMYGCRALRAWGRTVGDQRHHRGREHRFADGNSRPQHEQFGVRIPESRGIVPALQTNTPTATPSTRLPRSR
jgi:hypothetical protein